MMPTPDCLLQVYAVQLDGCAAPPPAWLAHLPPAQQARAREFRHDRDRLSYVAAQCLTRLALARTLPGTAPRDLAFHTDPFGKPHLSGPGPHFNLSHTTGMAVAAISPHGPVGVDVEAVNAALATLELARSIFTPAEVTDLQAHPHFPTAFTRLWSAKEAVIKADGRGLTLNLSNIHITPHAASGDGGVWDLWQTQWDDGPVLTVASIPASPRQCHRLTAPQLTQWAENPQDKF